jgi:hypothetical protein
MRNHDRGNADHGIAIPNLRSAEEKDGRKDLEKRREIFSRELCRTTLETTSFTL